MSTRANLSPSHLFPQAWQTFKRRPWISVGMWIVYVMFSGQGYRRLGKKTRNQHVATLFGKVCLWRFPYRFWERGVNEPCIFPLELQFGLVQGVTPALADLIGRRMAEAGATQKRVLQQLREEHAVSMGVKRLRKLVAALAEGLSEYREAS